VLKISEVFEEQVKVTKERPDGSEYVNFEKVYTTRECLLNTKYVVSVHPYEFSSSVDLRKIEGRFPEGTKFSTFVVDGNSFRASEITVVGSFDKFCGILEDGDP
tara:strand:+ start:3164 stop:3475 length:312 start_codon:yes stop_codon:yes gene_type:complete